MVYSGADGPQALNFAGATGLETFFLVDYEKEVWFVAPVAELPGWGIQFQTNDQGITTNQKIPQISRITPPTPETYKAAFDYVQDQQRQGNSFLCNLTFPSPIAIVNGGLEDIYEVARAPFKLLVTDRRISPLPFVVFSPESFLTSDRDWIVSSPMKGTSFYRNLAFEEQTRERLLNNPKEQAEHRTIVDLIRNDLGIICPQVRVDSYRYLEKISLSQGFLWATSSRIAGKTPPKWNSEFGTLLSSVLPAGSITGAPKRETCRIIEQAESEPRGFYTGVAGILGPKGLRSWVLIRFIEGNPGNYRFRSGGGITIYSDRKSEYQELIAKIGIPSGL